MNKKQIQKRILKNGKPLALCRFSWDEKTNTIGTSEGYCVMDMGDVDDSTQKAGDYSTQKAGYSSTQKAGNYSTQTAGYSSTQTAGHSSTQKAGSDSIQTAGSGSTQTAGNYSTQKAGSDSIQTAGNYSTQKAGNYSTQKAGYSSTQTASSGSTHYIEDNCTVVTNYCSIIHVNGERCAIVNRNVFEVITPNKGDIIQICPNGVPGHLVNGMYNGEPHIIADGILSKIISQKGDVYRVINHGGTKQSYLIKSGDTYAHGATLKEARESLIYKISDRDTSKYDGLTMQSEITFAEAVSMYRTITGACEGGCKYFVERNGDKKKDKYTVAELIELTRGQYNHELLVKYMEGK